MDPIHIVKLHKELLTFWNTRDAKGMASLFTEDANVIGFDGSQMNGKSEIETEMSKIFDSHKTSTYVWKVREVRFLNSTVAVLCAIVGMVPPGKKDIKPDVNAIQALVATSRSDDWKITLFQNTPARFDGRPELSQQMTEELRALLPQ